MKCFNTILIIRRDKRLTKVIKVVGGIMKIKRSIEKRLVFIIFLVILLICATLLLVIITRAKANIYNSIKEKTEISSGVFDSGFICLRRINGKTL